MKLNRVAVALGILSALVASSSFAQGAKPAPTRGPATLKELMTLVVDPASAGIFKVASEAPKNDAEWKTLQGQALTLLEAAKTLTSPSRAKDQKQWMQDAKALQNASKTAFAAAMAKNTDGLADLNDSLYTTCSNCHEHYMPKR